MKKYTLRTPITYYGGKQKLAKTVISFIPNHRLYCEPFLGGGAVFFSKPPSEIEVINDTNSEMMNFYRVAKNRFHELQALIKVTLHSRRDHSRAWVIYNNPDLFDEVRRAWAIWVLSTMSFSTGLDGSFGYDKSTNQVTKKVHSKREGFTEEIAYRLQFALLECADAMYIIQSRDSPDSFFYCDPPYFNSDCGHYDGYTESDFDGLLRLLSNIKGKFILSSYPSELLQRYSKEYGWNTWSVEQGVSVNAKSGYLKRKTEVMTANFKLKD